jgi:DNA-directed RNA polymerase subunit RPC12/RpoP
MRFYRCKHCSERFLSVSSIRFARCPACGERLSRVWMPPVPRADPGTYPPSPGTHASMDDFVTSDARRLLSPEVDFGLYWREREAAATHRAAWIEETGELYVVKAGPSRLGGGHVEVLATADRRRIDEALEGWEEQCGRPGSMDWLRGRAAGVARSGRRWGARARTASAVALGAALLAFSGWGALPQRAQHPKQARTHQVASQRSAAATPSEAPDGSETRP